MADAKQKEFNRFIGGYINNLRREDRIDVPVCRPKPKEDKACLDKAVVLSEKELDMAALKGEGKKGFFEMIRGIFGSQKKTEQETLTPEEIFRQAGVESIGVQPRNASDATKIAQPVALPRRDVLKKTGDSEMAKKREEWVKPEQAGKQETIYVVRVCESLLSKLPQSERNQFMRSREYLFYETIKKKYF